MKILLILCFWKAAVYAQNSLIIGTETFSPEPTINKYDLTIDTIKVGQIEHTVNN